MNKEKVTYYEAFNPMGLPSTYTRKELERHCKQYSSKGMAWYQEHGYPLNQVRHIFDIPDHIASYAEASRWLTENLIELYQNKDLALAGGYL